MKKIIKILILSLCGAGVLATASYFAATEIIKEIERSNSVKTFTNKLEEAHHFHIDSLDLKLYDLDSLHTLELNFNNLYLHHSSDDNYSFKGKLNVAYDYIEIFSGNSTFIDNTFYLDTESSVFTTSDVSFNINTIKDFRVKYNDSTLAQEDIFNFDFGFSILDGMYEKIEEIKIDDDKSHLFEFNLLEYNSSLMFYSDENYNLKKIKTSQPLESGSTLLSINATNIKYEERFILDKPANGFLELDETIDSISNLLELFNTENGKGLHLFVGNLETHSPLEIVKDDESIIKLLGTVDIFNKNDEKDFLIKFEGEISLNILDYKEIAISTTLYLIEDVIYFYLNEGTITKGSLKLETLGELLNIDFMQVSKDMKLLLFNFFDLILINSSIDSEYVLLEDLTVEDNTFKTTMVVPVTESDTENTKIYVEGSFDENMLKSISTSDISNGDYTIKNIMLSFSSEIGKRPEINTSEYTSYDEIIKNLINFN